MYIVEYQVVTANYVGDWNQLIRCVDRDHARYVALNSLPPKDYPALVSRADKATFRTRYRDFSSSTNIVTTPLREWPPNRIVNLAVKN